MSLPSQELCGSAAWSEADRLAALNSYRILDTDRESGFDDIVQLAADIFDAPIAVVNLIADDRQWFKAEIGIGQRELPLDVSICRHAILQPGVFVVPDLTADARFETNPLVLASGGLRFYAGALLETEDGLPLGTVCVLDTKPRPNGISEREERALRSLASQTMAQLELRRAVTSAKAEFARAEAYSRRHNFLVELGDALRDLADPAEIKCVAAQLLGRHLDIDRAGYGDIDVSGEVVRVERDWTGSQGASLAGEARILDAFGPRVIDELRAGRTLVVEDCRTDERTSNPDHLGAWASIGTRALVVVPYVKDDRLDAIFYGHAAQPRTWSDLDVKLAEDVARRTWSAVERARAEAAMRESEAQKRLITNALPLMIAFIDADVRYRFVNGAYERWFGRPADAMLGRSVRELLGEDTFNLRRDRIEAALRGEPQYFEAFTPTPDGARRYTEIAYVPRHDEQGSVDGFFVLVTDISERKESERQQRLLAAVVEQSSDFIGIAGAGEHAFFVNEAGRRLVGLDSLEEVQRTRVIDYFAPEDQAFVHDVILPTQEREGRWVGEFPFRHFKTGAKIPMLYNQFVIRDGQGERIGVATVSRDISAQKAVQAALAEKAAEFEALAENVSQLAWMAEPDGSIFWYNKRWYEYTGTDLEAMKGWGWREVHHPDHVDRVIAEVSGKWQAGQAWEGVYLLRGADGVFRPFLTRAEPILDERGTLVRWFGTNTDISQQVAAEAALAELNRTLEAQVAERTAERDRIWQLSPSLMLVARLDGTMLSANPAWERLLGWSPEWLAGRSASELKHPDDAARTAAELARLAAGGYQTVGFEDRYRHRDGGWRWISWVIQPEGDLLYCIGRDVTGEKKAAAELEQAQDALRQSQKMEAIGQLTGGVAHDFNNLLTVIRSAADLLRRRELTEEKRRRYVDAISDTADRAAKLTGQLLAFARRQALKPEVFDAGDRVQAIADMLRTVVGSRIDLDIVVAPDTGLVEADAPQFEAALVNLVVNARDAMNGVGRLRIEARSEYGIPSIRGQGSIPGQFVSVAVTDTGHGIPLDKLGRIFEPFFTTKDVGKGTGLGLSQVYGFAKQSGGDVAVASHEGQGTTFTLFLPSAAGSDPARSREQLANPDLDGGGHVLVVEDNDMVGVFATQLLQELGYRTSRAESAEAALKLLHEHPDDFDIVFSDVVMPGKSGVDLARDVKRLRPELPVILTSGYSDVLANGHRDGLDLLQKPYSVEELARVLNKARRKSR